MDAHVTRKQQDDDHRMQKLFNVIWSRDDPKKVQELLEQGVGPNGVNSVCDGESILHVCVHQQHYQSVLYLLSRSDLNVDIPNSSGDTALHAAIKRGSLRMFEYLMSHDGIDVNVQGRRKLTPLHLIVKRGRHDMLKKILQRNDIKFNLPDCFWKALPFIASYGQCYDILLQDSRVDVNHKTRMRGNRLCFAVLQNDVQQVRQLLQHPQICLNPRDDYRGRSPIFLLEHTNLPGPRLEAIDLLLQDERTILTTRDNNGKTILDYPLKISAKKLITRAERLRTVWARRKIRIISQWSFDDKVIPDDVLTHHLLPLIADVITPVEHHDADLDEFLSKALQ